MTGPLGFHPSLPQPGLERVARNVSAPAVDAKPTSAPERFSSKESPQPLISNEVLVDLETLVSSQPVSAHAAELTALMPLAQVGDEALTRADIDVVTDVLVHIETRFPLDGQRNILLQLAEQLRPDTQAQSLIQTFQSLSAAWA
jgi:hypothetical protein